MPLLLLLSLKDHLFCLHIVEDPVPFHCLAQGHNFVRHEAGLRQFWCPIKLEMLGHTQVDDAFL